MVLYRASIVIIFLSLSGCAREDPRIVKSSGGYLTSSKAVRFWRTDSPGSVTLILTHTNQISSNETVQTRYYWKKNRLMSIKQQRNASVPETTLLRFDENGQLTFMQRQRLKVREALSTTDVSDLQRQARSLYAVSEKSRSAGAILRQGVWLNDGLVESCEKKPTTVRMTEAQRAQLKKLAVTHSPVYLSWLEANSGSQLLYSSTMNLCLPQNETVPPTILID